MIYYKHFVFEKENQIKILMIFLTKSLIYTFKFSQKYTKYF